MRCHIDILFIALNYCKMPLPQNDADVTSLAITSLRSNTDDWGT